MTKTCKIKLRLDIDDKDERIKKYKELDLIGYELQNVRNSCIRSCVTFYELKKNKIEYLVPEHLFKQGDENMTYRKFLNRFRPDLTIATGTQANLIEQEVIQKFKGELKEYHSGKKSIPTFSDKKIPSLACSSKLDYDDNGYKYIPSGMSKQGFVFRFVNPEKDKSLFSILSRIMSGDYKMCDHFLKRDGKFWYLFLCYSFEVVEKKIDKNICVGVDVGFKIPAVCALRNSEERAYLGDSGTLLKFKTQIISRKRRLQKEGGKTGHGKKRVMKSYTKLKDFESNFVKDYNHKISKKVVEFAIKNNAGTIIIEDLHNGVKNANKLLTRAWSYYQLQQMILYKAKEAGVDVVKIPPHYTSQTCSLCGHTARENRKTQSEFACVKCGYSVNADYNAAKNIAAGGLNCSPVEDEAIVIA